MSKQVSSVTSLRKKKSNRLSKTTAISTKTSDFPESIRVDKKSISSRSSFQQLIPQDIDIIKMNNNNIDIVIELSPIDVINMTNEHNMLLIKGDQEHCIKLNDAQEIQEESDQKAPYRAFSMGAAQVFVEKSIDVIIH